MKKIIAIVSLICLLLSLTTVFAFAEDTHQPIVLEGSALQSAFVNKYGPCTADYIEADQMFKVIGTETKANATQLSLSLGGIFSGADYPFMVLKYRFAGEYDKAALSIYRINVNMIDEQASNAEVQFSSRSKDGQIATVSDGEWHTAVLDMRKISFEAQKSADKSHTLTGVSGFSWETFSYGQLTVIPYGWNSVNESEFDLAALALFATEEEANEYAGVEKLSDPATGYTYDAKRIELVSRINMNESINISATLAQDESFVTLTTNQTSGAKAGRLFIAFDSEFDPATQKYFAIKYRYNDNKLVADMELMRAIDDSGNANPLSRMYDGSILISTESDWQTVVIDLTTIQFDNDDYVGKTWATYDLKGVYLMPWGASATNGATIDIVALGFSDTENNARAIVGLDPIEPTPTESSEENTSAQEQPTSAPEKQTEIQTPEDNTGSERKSGCASTVSTGIVFAIVTVCGMATMVVKKKEY